jgi:uncharacterized protein YhfF
MRHSVNVAIEESAHCQTNQETGYCQKVESFESHAKASIQKLDNDLKELTDLYNQVALYYGEGSMELDEFLKSCKEFYDAYKRASGQKSM